MRIVLSTLTAAMIASASFAGAALANGDYYEGASKAVVSENVDRVNTGSIEQARANVDRDQPIFKHESRDNR